MCALYVPYSMCVPAQQVYLAISIRAKIELLMNVQLYGCNTMSYDIFLRLYMYVLIRYVILYETVAPYSVKRLCVLTVNFSLETTSPCTYTCMSFHWECMFVLSYCMCS